MTRRRGDSRYHNAEAEAAVVGSLMLRNQSLFDFQLSTADFYDPHCRATYGAIVELLADGEVADPITIEAKLGDRSPPIEKLLEYSNAIPTTENVRYYAKLVREKRIERDVRRAAFEIYRSQTEGAALADEAQKALVGLGGTFERDRPATSIGDICDEVIAEVQRRKAGEKPAGLVSGFPEIDEYLAVSKGGVIVFAGRPSMGKSATAQFFADAIEAQGERVLVFSTESARIEYGQRRLSFATDINSRRIARGHVSFDEVQRLKAARDKAKDRALWVDDHAFEIESIVRQIRRYKAQEGITAVIVDHIQEVSVGRSRSRMDAINTILEQLRAVAREDPKLYLILLSQLNRNVESRENKRPLLSDLRDSGRIEEIADMILLFFRQYYYDKEKGDPDILDALVAKNRNGPTGAIRMVWDNDLGHCRGPYAKANTGESGRLDLD